MQLEEMQIKISLYHVLEGSSKNLDEIIKNQWNSPIKFGLGFKEGQSLNGPQITNAKLSKIEEMKVQVNQAKLKLAKEDARYDKNVDDDGFTNVVHQRRRFMAPTATWKRSQTKFIFFFSGYYFKCNAYGHKISNCKYNIEPRNFANRNALSLLRDYAVECYSYHNFGHITRNCRSTFFSNQFQGRWFQQNGIIKERKFLENHAQDIENENPIQESKPKNK